MISTARRVEYALGYLGLGMIDQASDELEAIAFSDRFHPSVMSARIELHAEAGHWDIVIGYGRQLSEARPDLERGWIGWACALREQNHLTEAAAVLLQAEPHHGKTSAILHFNLACYLSLLGDHEEARSRLRKACRMDRKLKEDVTREQDLAPLWNEASSL